MANPETCFTYWKIFCYTYEKRKIRIFTKLSELDDVEFSDDKGNTDLLTVKNGKVTDIDLEEVTEIPPSVITGGTF